MHTCSSMQVAHSGPFVVEQMTRRSKVVLHKGYVGGVTQDSMSSGLVNGGRGKFQLPGLSRVPIPIGRFA